MENSTGSYEDAEPVSPTSNPNRQSCLVDAALASKFEVTVPKKITLSGSAKSGTYSVTCKGDIAGNESVSVVPDATFTMSQTEKATVQAAVTQEKTMFRGSDYTGDLGNAVKMGPAAGDSTGTPLTGSIAAPDLSAGAWSGAFNFTIGLKEVLDPLTLTDDNLSSYVDAETGEAIATSGDVVIPAVVKDSVGKKYQVTRIEGKVSYEPYPAVKSIFPDASTVTSVIIPDSVTSIGEGTFYNCSGLTFITIPDGVTYIGEDAFSCCSGLTSITIPDSVTSIGKEAFCSCNSLTSITIPDSVTSIGEKAFFEYSGLTSITVDKNNTVYDSRENCNAIIETASNTLLQGCNNTVIPAGVTSIGGYAFSGCKGLTSITIPDGVTSIGEGAFSGCSGLTAIIIPESVTSIGESVFINCKGLTSISIPDGVTSIEYGVFGGCSSLTSITIPDSVTSIGKEAFDGCSSLSSITIPDSVTEIGYYAFYDCSKLSSITYRGQAYTSKSALTQALTDNSVTIRNNAFGRTALSN